MTHSDKAPTAEQIKMARRIAAEIMFSGDFDRERRGSCLKGGWDGNPVVRAALAAIIETTELAAKHAAGMPPFVHAADVAWDFRNGYHLKGQTHD